MAASLDTACMVTMQGELKVHASDVPLGKASHLLDFGRRAKMKGHCTSQTHLHPLGGGYSARQTPAIRRRLLVKCDKDGEVLVADDGKSEPLNQLILHTSEAIHQSSQTNFWTNNIGREIWRLALPAVITQAIEPMAQLMETAYVGRLGSVELAAVGVSVSVFNLVSKIFNVPLLGTTTSFVAEDNALHEALEEKNVFSTLCQQDSLHDSTFSEGRVTSKKRILPAVSSSLFLALILALVEAVVLFLGAGSTLKLMGVPAGSPMRSPATTYLALRALGAPANVFALAIQGIFRGLKDTKTPLYAIAISNICNIAMCPILIFVFHFGVIGAAIARVVSEYLLAFLLLWNLDKQVQLISPTFFSLRLNRFLKSGGFLIGRTMAVLFTMTLATSMAARQGAIAMAGHQILMQIWLATSLLSDALALAGQAIMANAYAKGDLKQVEHVALAILQMGFYFGLLLAFILAVGLGPIAKLFTTDTAVLAVLSKGVLFVAGTQPLNALAFVFDGLHYGVSDFKYAAYSMMVVGLLSSLCLMIAPSFAGLPGVWLGLTFLMGFRVAAGWLRFNSTKGPWQFLRQV